MQYTDKSFREIKSELNQTASTLPKHKKKLDIVNSQCKNKLN